MSHLASSDSDDANDDDDDDIDDERNWCMKKNHVFYRIDDLHNHKYLMVTIWTKRSFRICSPLHPLRCWSHSLCSHNMKNHRYNSNISCLFDKGHGLPVYFILHSIRYESRTFKPYFFFFSNYAWWNGINIHEYNICIIYDYTIVCRIHELYSNIYKHRGEAIKIATIRKRYTINYFFHNSHLDLLVRFLNKIQQLYKTIAQKSEQRDEYT